MGNPGQALSEFIELVVERKMREADVSDGSRVPHGSEKHVKDLEVRIADLTRWRDKQKRGSEARANYARLIGRLKGELSSARRAAAKNAPKRRTLKSPVTENLDEPTVSAEERWQALANGEDPDVKGVVDMIKGAADPRALGKAKREVEKMMDSGLLPKSVSDGFVHWLYDQRKAELASMNYTPRSAADARTDAILRIRDSSGRAKARK